MPVKNILSALTCAAVLGVASAHAADINLTTEDYKPFNYMEDGKIVGFGADQVFEIMDRAGITYAVEMAQWSRAIGLAETRPGFCVFTAAHTAERDAKFSWVEPLNVDRTLLIKKVGSDVNPADVEDAKRYVVGTQSQDFTETLLTQMEFPKIDAAGNMEATLKKLEAGRVDLVAVSGAFYEALKRDGRDVEQALIISETVLSMACNPGTDAGLIARMQSALDEMIADGTQAEILAKYQ
ncbi:ABC transporter substrate-binding protein [Roseibium aquae]|uniref:ABC transporter substrate-binding protein n=1 Tax=Roseibium aquae TaxID=1323746 RepID=A0A916TIK9_9HYPH|nr:transporter substrate-binding domain-containing protein [Roseibium aquae]GGB43371.1 ABC transporter substrate-binding protein [Roseibium aquae]